MRTTFSKRVYKIAGLRREYAAQRKRLFGYRLHQHVTSLEPSQERCHVPKGTKKNPPALTMESYGNFPEIAS
jgi:hypothetical protein